jgi:hypothetical protein
VESWVAFATQIGYYFRGNLLAKADGASVRELAKIEKQDLLILDYFEIQRFEAQTCMT